MKIRLLTILFCLCGWAFEGNTQTPVSFFQPLTWEQASLQAARENKLVLVEMGPVGKDLEKLLSKDRERLNYIRRHVVAVRMDVNTLAGQAFLPRLLMYEPPYYAFFMPYSDLVGGMAAAEVALRPDALREALEEALRQAAVKRMNSRSVRFVDLPFKEVLQEAAGHEKNVFIAIHKENCQACLLMEKNIYRLDQVADFYNQQFISMRLNEPYAGELTGRYGIKDFPAFVFLNPDGKLLFKTEGYQDAGQLVAKGQEALKKAGGIVFDTLSPDEAREKAQKEGKLIFTDYHVPGSGHTEMVKKVFADPDVNDFFTAHFVNISHEAEKNRLVFEDAGGEELHRVEGAENAASLLEEAKRAVGGKGVAGLTAAYEKGSREADFMEEYTQVLYRAGMKEKSSEMAMEYLSGHSPEILKTPHYWEFFCLYVTHADPVFFDFLLAKRQEFYALYGEQAVRRKIAALWIAGAESFVRKGVFDENGFKEYTKRLKKEKVEGWRSIVRNARMHAAEQTGDWKTYVTLAEEKWNEEKVSDAELYSWGIKIEQECHDEGIRYVAARWFAERAMEIDRKERLTGKMKMGSYKGFFEKLVNDLAGKN